MTFGDYKEQLASVLGVCAGAIEACPLLSGLLPDKIGLYFFPPLSSIFRVAAVILGLLVFVGVYQFRSLKWVESARGRVAGFATFLVLALAGLFLFLIAQQHFVRTIEIPSLGQGQTVTVAVGYDRTDDANTRFPGWSDWKILRDYGHGEDDISTIWTKRSVTIARIAVLASYLLFLLSALGGLCTAVLFQALGDPSS